MWLTVFPHRAVVCSAGLTLDPWCTHGTWPQGALEVSVLRAVSLARPLPQHPRPALCRPLLVELLWAPPPSGSLAADPLRKPHATPITVFATLRALGTMVWVVCVPDQSRGSKTAPRGDGQTRLQTLPHVPWEKHCPGAVWEKGPAARPAQKAQGTLSL